MAAPVTEGSLKPITRWYSRAASRKSAEAMSCAACARAPIAASRVSGPDCSSRSRLS